jgi:TonB family protein
MAGLRNALAATSLILFAIPSPAQEHRAPVWQMDWGDQFCSLIRLPDVGTPFAVVVRAIPGRGFSDILLLPRAHGQPPEVITSIMLAPSGRSFDVYTDSEELGDRSRAVALHALPMEFWDALAGSDQLQLRQGRRVLSRIQLTDASQAVRALRQCVSNALREWGIDEAAMNALRRRPVSVNALGMSDQDYPQSAIQQNTQGRVIVRVDVSAQGRATACAAVASSHTAAIDAAACHAAMTRGRFRPALDANGLPTASQIVTAVRFLLPN